MSMPDFELSPSHLDEPGGPGGAEAEAQPLPDQAPPAAVGGDDPTASAEVVPAAEPDPLAARTGWRLVSLIPHDGTEPPAGLDDALAQASWCAVTAPWHPSLLARLAELPRVEPVETPTSPGPREIRIVATGALERLPSGYSVQAEDAGCAVLESGGDRAALIAQIQQRLGAVGTPETSDDPAALEAAADFLALGTARWLIRDLAIAMSHPDAVNQQALTREVLIGADAWQACDRPTAVNRLRAAFEVLTQARERFYPVDAYLVDLCLLDPALPGGVLAAPLGTRVAITLLAPGQAIENQAAADPAALEALRQAITEGWADVAGGPYAEAEDLLLPLESIFWQFRRGNEAYRAHLDERSVETYARRRFGLYTQLPQVARRHGFRFALHLGFDAGRFPVRSEPKRLWESPDGSNLETLFRPPLAADRASQGLMVPWRLGASMRNDHVATLPLAHWPSPVADWYLDLRRAATYSPVLGRWVTLNDYFHLTDRPYETFRPDPDSYQSPFLAQAVARRDERPVSGLAQHHRLRARLESLEWVSALARAVSSPGPESESATEAPSSFEAESLREAETLLETGRASEASAALDRLAPLWPDRLAHAILATPSETTTPLRGGYLVINTLGIPRRVAVLLPEAAIDLRPEGPLRAAQLTDEGMYAVVDVPAFGFAWVPRENGSDAPPYTPQTVSCGGTILKNESIELEVDQATGGIRGVMAVGESTPRLGQQLVMLGLGEADGKPVAGQMKAERFEIDYGGPALAQATSTGKLIDPGGGKTLARFQQRFRLWTGRPILEIDVTLSELDPAWLEREARSDPWRHYLACRWAWPDPASMLRRTVLLAPELTELERPETPDAFDISTRRQHTALLFGGLSYHQKYGKRMLDTLLVAGREAERSFRLGVVLDLEHPMQGALDLTTPAFVAAADGGPPAAGSRGWLLHVEQKSAVVTHVGFVEATGEGRAWGLVLHVLETAGQSCRCRIRFFRNPTWARQVDFQGELVIDLSTEGDGIMLDLTPNELACVEVTLG